MKAIKDQKIDSLCKELTHTFRERNPKNVNKRVNRNSVDNETKRKHPCDGTIKVNLVVDSKINTRCNMNMSLLNHLIKVKIAMQRY